MFYQNLTPKQGYKRKNAVIRAAVVALVLLCTLYSLRTAPLLMGLSLLALPLGIGLSIWLDRKEKFFFASEAGELRYRTSYSPRVRKIHWQDIDSIRIGPAYVRFMLKGHKKRQVSLGWLPYDTLRELKSLVEAEARQYHVSCTVVRIAS